VSISEDQRELGQWLKKNGTAYETLIGDALAYEAIVMQPEGNRFVFPFEYEYGMALRMPRKLPGQVVVPDPSRPGAFSDPMTRWYPGFYEQGSRGDEIIYDRNGWRIWRKPVR
jgi:hypothetical protein